MTTDINMNDATLINNGMWTEVGGATSSLNIYCWIDDVPDWPNILKFSISTVSISLQEGHVL